MVMTSMKVVYTQDTGNKRWGKEGEHQSQEQCFSQLKMFTFFNTMSK